MAENESSILVIDDEPASRELLCKHLKKSGYKTLSAANGKKGIQLASKNRPAVIILELMMPGMDGWMVISHIKADQDLEHIPIIICTLLAREEYGFNLNVDDFLLQGFTG